MGAEKQAEFVKLHIRLRQATDSLHTRAQEVYEMAKRLEDLTKDTAIRYATLRVSVEASAAFERAKDLRRVLEQMGKQMRGEV